MTNWDTKILGQDEPNVPINPGIRWNPNVAYSKPDRAPFSPQYEIFLRAVDKAIKNGWQGWKLWVLSATTIGLEAETMVQDIIKAQTRLEPILFDHDFAKRVAVIPSDYLTCMALAEDRIKELEQWI
jgi:hypothetical protein